MNKRILFVLFFFQSYLFAYQEGPVKVDLYGGYRVDEFECKLLSNTNEQVLVYSERLKHPQYVQTGASLDVLTNGFYLFADFGYAPLLTHKLKNIDTDEDLIQYKFDYKVKGYDLNGALEIGIVANLTPDRLYKFYIIPLVGYDGFWKSYKRKDPHPLPYSKVINNEKVEGFGSLGSKKFSEVWYGPYLGGKLYIEPNDFVSFDLAYHFNWLKLKLKFLSLLETLKYEDDGELAFDEMICKNFDGTISHGYSHFVFAKATFNTSRHIKVACFLRYNYLMNDKNKATVTVETRQLFPQSSEKVSNSLTKVYSRWWNLTGALELIFHF